jgi:SAM-dependent methyltransferase
MKNTWSDYYKKNESPPNKAMVEALRHVEVKGTALDIGAGALIDSKYLLSAGFDEVVAFDINSASAERASTIQEENFTFIQTTFDEYQYPKNHFDYINAQFCLHFIHPDNFKSIFSKILTSLKPGGVFAGHLFGDRDGWNTPDTRKTLLSRHVVDSLFEQVEVITLDEIEYDKKTVLGGMKHWHQFNFIVRKY